MDCKKFPDPKGELMGPSHAEESPMLYIKNSWGNVPFPRPYISPDPSEVVKIYTAFRRRAELIIKERNKDQTLMVNGKYYGDYGVPEAHQDFDKLLVDIARFHGLDDIAIMFEGMQRWYE